jgi:multidrug efflux pump subunit AcrA (membrane-fusion protein)
MTTQVDLRQLAVERPGAGSRPLTRKRAWLTRWAIPLAIVAGFISIAGWSAREYWLPAKPVTVVPVMLAKAEIQQAGTPLFQAAGWVEPRPTAVMVSALVEGIIAELLVVEGQEVTAGQPIARLVDAEAQIAVREAEATLQLREAERDAAKAAMAAAQGNFQMPVHLEAALAEADAALAQIQTEMKNLPFAIRGAESRLQLARQDLEGKKSVANEIAGRLLQKSQSEFDAAVAAMEELRQRGPSLEAQGQACSRRCEALRTKLALKTDERRALDETTANFAAAAAKVTHAQLAVESARLRLERMTVRAPITGRVLSLNAQPGRRLMGINAASERDSSTVATLYDPQQLQIRADVRLEDVPQVQIGQPVQIVTASLKQPLRGHVLATTSQADIQKNTLSVKVAIDEPPTVIKPEMLAQVTFLAPEVPGEKTDGESDPMRLLVARELVETGESGAAVWIADSAQGIARRQAVQLGRAGTNQLAEVTTGITALDKLIVGGREGLKSGDRIRVTGEDRALGTTQTSGQFMTTAEAAGPTKK